MNLDIFREPKLSAATTYHGVYQGVAYEIKNWPPYSSMMNIESCWAHYIIINVDKQIAPPNQDGFWLPAIERKMGESTWISHDYMDAAIGRLEWHGGITFYEKIRGLEGGDRVIKAGCDYQHLWDEGQRYSLESVLSEVKETIDSLWRSFGPAKARSTMDGKYYEF